MYWYKYFLISILIIFTSFAYAGKDQIVFSGKLYEYIDTHKITSDTALTLAKTNKTIKPIVILENEIEQSKDEKDDDDEIVMNNKDIKVIRINKSFF